MDWVGYSAPLKTGLQYTMHWIRAWSRFRDAGSNLSPTEVYGSSAIDFIEARISPSRLIHTQEPNSANSNHAEQYWEWMESLIWVLPSIVKSGPYIVCVRERERETLVPWNLREVAIKHLSLFQTRTGQGPDSINTKRVHREPHFATLTEIE